MTNERSTPSTSFKVTAMMYPGFYATESIEADSLDEAITKAKSRNWGDEPFEAPSEWPAVQSLLVESDDGSRLVDLAPSGDAALSLLRRLIEDVKIAFGTGDGDTIDTGKLDWPDLAATYHQAIAILGSDEQTAPGRTVITAIYEHDYGTDVRAFRNEAQAHAWRNEVAKEWWDTEFSDAERATDADIGAEYFDRMRDGGNEFFSIQACTVE